MQSQLRSLLLFIAICCVSCILLTTQNVQFLPWSVQWRLKALRQHRTTLNTKVEEYDITFVQDPVYGYYQTYFVVKKDGQEGLSYLMINHEDNNERSLNMISKDGVVHFCDGTNVAISIARVDTNTMTLYAGLTGKRQLQDLKFDGKFVNSGGSPRNRYVP